MSTRIASALRKARTPKPPSTPPSPYATAKATYPRNPPGGMLGLPLVAGQPLPKPPKARKSLRSMFG